MFKNIESGRVKGGAYIFMSAFFFGTYGIWARLMSGVFGEFTQAWTRGLFLLAVILIINAKFKLFKPVKRNDFKWFAIIALCGGLNQAPYFFGFKYLNIGTATLLFYAALVVGGYLIGKLVFHEKFTKVKIISLILSIFGMLAIYKLTLNSDQFLAAGLTIMAGFMGAVGAVLPKKLSGDYPEFQIMSGYFTVMIIANGALGFLFKEQMPGISQTIPWIAQFFYAVTLFLANWSVIEGFKHIDASIGSLIGLAEILFGIMFGVIFFKEIVGMGTLIGAILIIVSAALPNISFGNNR